MKLAVVGSREGADLNHVSEFLHQLAERSPGVVVVSGGARGVDSRAERTWRDLGGSVVSFRPKRIDGGADTEVYGVERLDGDEATVLTEPNFADYRSALLYRDILIAEECDRLVAFMRKGGSRGANGTACWADEALGKPVFRFEAA